MKQRLILATDIGTTSVRSMIQDAYGKVYGKQQLSYQTKRPEKFFEQQDPVQLRTEVLHCMKLCIEEVSATNRCEICDISGVTFSSQMYSIMAIDRDGNPLTDSILWSDGRAENEVNDLQNIAGPLGFYKDTGCPPSSIFPIGKILWIKKNLPQVFAKTYKFISIKEFVTASFLDEYIVDYSIASATGLFDIFHHCWHEEAIKSIGISKDSLSQPISGLDICNIKNKQLLNNLGLSENTVLILAGGDGPLANLGSGASHIGAVNIDLGTSGAARVLTDHPITDAKGNLWCFSLTKELWVYGGILSNVGNAFDWLSANIVDSPFNKKSINCESGCKSLSKLAGAIPCGSNGLYFLPYLRKARSPYWNNKLQGTLIGLHADHDIRHITRALIESISYDLQAILLIMNEYTKTEPQILLSGGISRGEHIAQILANITNRPVRVRTNSEASLEGAAIMALHGLGELPTLSFLSNGKDIGNDYLPNPSNVSNYKKLYSTYIQLVKNMTELYQTME